MKREFGLDASVGIAPNKLLAKLASGRAKPNGVCAVLSDSEIGALLAALPALCMPGCGGKIADTFAGAGISSIANVQVGGSTQTSNSAQLAVLITMQHYSVKQTPQILLLSRQRCESSKVGIVAGVERGGHAHRAGIRS